MESVGSKVSAGLQSGVSIVLPARKRANKSQSKVLCSFIKCEEKQNMKCKKLCN